jgi:hypothetical protein
MKNLYLILLLTLNVSQSISQPIPFSSSIPSSGFYYQLVDTIVKQGLRNAGSPADLWVENYGMSLFNSYGLQNVTTQSIPIQSWQVNSAKVKITSTNGIQDLSLFPQLFVDWSDTVSAPWIKFDSTTALSAVAGKIVIVDYKLDLFAPAAFAPNVIYTYDPDNNISNTIHPQPIPHRSNASGALISQILSNQPKAIICILNNFYNTDKLWGLYSRTDSIYDIPCFWMSRGNSQTLNSIFSTDPNSTLSIEFNTQDNPVNTRNVYGILPGNSSQYIVFNSHHDGQFYGATEDGAGIALVAAQAKYWSQVPQSQRPFNMVFLWDAAHLKQSIGSEFFVDNTPNIINNTLLCFTLETPSLEGRILNGNLITLNRPEPRWFYTSDTLSLRQSLYNAVQTEDLRRTFVAPPTLNGPSPIGDSHAFYDAGIPIVAHLSTPVWYMSAADSTDKLDTASMDKITRTVIRMIWNLPNITGIPSFEKANFSIYPNPSNDNVIVSGLNINNTGEYVIINLAGIELIKGKFQNTPDIKINLSELASGMYLIKINDPKGQTIAINRLIKN